MKYEKCEVKKGITAHCINTNLFKTNLIAVFITEKLSAENATMNTLIPAILGRGTENMPTQEAISKKLEELYGAEYNCGIDKTGDNHILKFYIEALNNNYIITNENLLQESIEKILEIIFNPKLEDGIFCKEYVETEKDKIKQLINSKIDNKDRYAMERCVEELYKGQPYGIYKYGNVEDLSKINAQNLYNRYQELLKNAKIDIFVSGECDIKELEKILKANQYINNLAEREPNYVINNETTEIKHSAEERNVIENMDVAQGKLVIGLDIFENSENSRYVASIYNTILGGSVNSKMFQNVREKEGLAYAIGSIYLKPKNNIFIKAGIEIENYEKTLELTKKQINDMKNGNFTDNDLEKAKKFIVAGVKSIIEEQEVGITYYIGQELSGCNVTPEEYLDRVNMVTREDVVDIANKIEPKLVYFLTNQN